MALAAVVGAVQTPVVAPENKYTPEQDVELGREAAAEARKQLPIMSDRQVTTYLDGLGRRLVAAIPDDFEHPEFRYTFQARQRARRQRVCAAGRTDVHQSRHDPGLQNGRAKSPASWRTSSSHVMLRHGTAQASKATKYELGTIAGAIAGAIIGGRVGSAVAQGTQFGLGTAFLRFGREFERQADIAGAQLMARAGYDPREMAAMFRTLESKGSSGGPEWMSGHPNPGNRADAILKEAADLRIVESGERLGGVQTGEVAPEFAASRAHDRRGRQESNGGHLVCLGRPERAQARRVEAPSGTVHGIPRRRHVQRERAVELERAGEFELGDIRAGRRV